MSRTMEKNPGVGPRAAIGVGWLARLIEWVGMASIVVMMLHVVAEVSLRSFFNMPIAGTLEMVTYWYIVLISFIGMWLAQQRKEHISVSLVTERLGLKSQAVAAIGGNIITMVLLAAFVWFGLEGALHQAALGEFSGATAVPVWPMRFVVPVTLGAFFLTLAAQTVQYIRTPSAVLADDILPETDAR
ncbi:MAG: TRAP transporter small permease [Actinomycetota bacterium]